MERADHPVGSLRQRKQQRVREAIIGAAHQLFTERGFDHVTVTDIAERAEVGRATFFRYFGDKQEVFFSDDPQIDSLVAEAARIPVDTPIGDSLPAALTHVRKVVVDFVRKITAEPEGYSHHEQLVAQHPELLARSLMKHRRYADGLVELLTLHGSSAEVAALASEIGVACYYAGRTTVDNDPRRLPEAVGAAFDRLS